MWSNQSVSRITTSVRKGFIFAFFWLIVGFATVAAQSNEFLSAIQSQGINTSSLTKSNAISRYDTVRLLSSVECIDCLNAPAWMRERYTFQWLKDFTAFPSNNFDDLSHPITPYKSLNYYYCVAYAADQGYVNGYPRVTSSYCPGKFCGVANTTMAEFIQIIFNITAKYSSINYNADWKSIESRALGLIPSDQVRIFDLDDLAVIKRSAQTCTATTCTRLSQAQLTAYAKYCTFNLAACNFAAFDGAPEKVWPVAQLNILVKEGILTAAQAQDLARVITKLAPGQQIIDIFSTINRKTQCTFDDDYDKDIIKNSKDNCTYVSNPSQTDTDRDGIGDVCDCDIDGDNVANGLGIIDNQGHIITQNLIPTAKDDAYRNSLYDQCELIGVSKLKGLQIGPDLDSLQRSGWTITQDPAKSTMTLKGPNNSCMLPKLQIPFRCEYKGTLDMLKRDFGDDVKITAGCYTSHAYTKPGTYTVTATSSDGAIAKTRVTILADSSMCKNDVSSYMTAIPLLQKLNKPVNYILTLINFTQSDISQVSCSYGDGSNKLFTGNNVAQALNQNYIYSKIGRYTAQCIITLKDGRTLPNAATVTIEEIDNCIFASNTNQQDLNKNGIGDQCEEADLLGLWVNNNARCVIAPATVDFTCTYTGAIGDIVWNFGDTGKANGCNVSHRYTTAGNYAVTATAPKGVKAATTVKVIGAEQQQGLMLNADKLMITQGATSTITATTLGSIDEIEYVSSMGTIKQSPSQKFVFKGDKPGTYSITAKAYYKQSLVAAAQIIIAVQTTTQRTAAIALVPTSLSIASNTPLRFTTIISNITSKNISSIKRDFGDGSVITNNDLTLTKIFLQAGPKVVTQTITLDDNTILTTMTTISVGGTSNQCLASYMSATPLIQSVGLPVVYQLNLLNFGPDQISKITCDYGDGNVIVFRDNIAARLTQPHVYLTAGRYTAQCTITLKDGMILPNAATVTVIGRDRCRDSSIYKCDMDRDTLPDVCDEDIDGDGTYNLMGLILYEKTNCVIDDSNINKPLEQYEHQQAATGVKLDNCPFIVNKDQADSNRDGYGNVCQVIDQVCTLFDGTSYPGPCPVLVDPQLPGLSTIQVKTCTKCPCQYVQGPTEAARSMLLNLQKSFVQVIGNSVAVR